NCGPQFGNQSCGGSDCCSQYGWCATSPTHCDPSTCQPPYSGPLSPCTTTTPQNHSSTIPLIDTCGPSQPNTRCPGAGPSGYFYRCCSAAGHCGPKNVLQAQSLYCDVAAGCQAGYGKCDVEGVPDGRPTGEVGTAGAGETCGPIVGRRCAEGLCCSGSNFCGVGGEFCGGANWCQGDWGVCD
ncbi:carbohydrate-binding module family 18 protein, partial [Saccharata proteae CBS 121410]